MNITRLQLEHEDGSGRTTVTWLLCETAEQRTTENTLEETSADIGYTTIVKLVLSRFTIFSDHLGLPLPEQDLCIVIRS